MNEIKEQDARRGISRRGFLGGAALAAIGATGVTALAGCAPQTKADATSGTGNSKVTGISEPQELNPQDETYDAYTTDYAAIFSPIQVGHLTLKNRIIKSASGTASADKKNPTVSPNQLEGYGKIAAGGAAMIMLETSALRGMGFGTEPTDITKEQAAEYARPLAEHIHSFDCYCCYQVSGPGGMGAPVVNEITKEEIAAYVEVIADRALRLKEAGFDGVEIKGATTDGLNAFLTRRQNNREDEYGPQSIENRARFFVEMIEAVREACGDDFLIAILMNALEVADEPLGGDGKLTSIDEGKEFAKLFEAAGANLIQVRVGAPGSEMNNWATDMNHAGYQLDGNTGFGNFFDYEQHMDGMIEGRYSGVAGFSKLTREMKSAVKVPVGCASYMDPRTAPDLINGLVADGSVDLLFMSRPLFVDPELPNKLKEGRRDEVAPCTRCLTCHGIVSGNIALPSEKPAKSCRVNAWFCHNLTKDMPEGADPTPAESPKRVMVVGGGPAGMEAARIAAERGHKVTLYEKDDRLGGLVRSSMGYKSKHERLQDLIDYLTRQQELKGVTVKLSTEVTADVVKQEGPDAVIVATGGAYDSRLKAADGTPAVVNMADGAADVGSLGERIVICGTDARAIDLALFLVANGKKVTMVHEGAEENIDKGQSGWYHVFLVKALYAKGVKIYSEAAVDGLGEGVVNITTNVGLPKALPCDTVIECWDLLPNAELADALGASYEVKVAGDCSGTFNIQSAIYAGNLAGRAV